MSIPPSAGQPAPPERRSPRILLIIADDRVRALLRAELRERGYDALGAPDPVAALHYRADEPDRGPVALILVADDALPHGAPSAAAALDALRQEHPDARWLLLTGVGDGTAGEWDAVLRRPLSIGEVAAAVAEWVPLPAEARHPLDR